MVDKHVVEAVGKAKVTIENGKVVDVSEPLIEYCPIFFKYRGIEKIDKEAIVKNIEFRIKDFGMCSPDRELEMEDFLSFGVSELISTLISEKVADCAVMVLEGAGTVIVKTPEMVQGIGGRVSGLVSTTPINEVIDKIGGENVLNPNNAEINQVEGVKKAISMGFKNIAVSVVSSDDAKKIRDLETDSINIFIFAVHVTGISLEEAEGLVEYCDILTSCASLNMRKVAEKENLYSVGSSVPIYSANEKGKEIIDLRLSKMNKLKDKKPKDSSKKPDIPNPLV